MSTSSDAKDSIGSPSCVGDEGPGHVFGPLDLCRSAAFRPKTRDNDPAFVLFYDPAVVNITAHNVPPFPAAPILPIVPPPVAGVTQLQLERLMLAQAGVRLVASHAGASLFHFATRAACDELVVLLQSHPLVAAQMRTGRLAAGAPPLTIEVMHVYPPRKDVLAFNPFGAFF